MNIIQQKLDKLNAKRIRFYQYKLSLQAYFEFVPAIPRIIIIADLNQGNPLGHVKAMLGYYKRMGL